MANFIIDFLALGTLFSSILSITFKNPVISVIFLILTFVQAAGYLIFIGINFIGISYIIIYVGAIAVLFLFVIMLLNIKLTDIVFRCCFSSFFKVRETATIGGGWIIFMLNL